MEKTVLQNSYRIKRKLPLNYDEIVDRDKFITECYEYGETYLYRLKNAYVTPYGVVMSNWRVVKEAIYSYQEKINFYPTFFKKILFNKVRKVPGLSVTATHVWFPNYYHFTTECLPRLYSLREWADKATLLLPEGTPAFVDEYVKLTGFSKVVKIPINELAQAEELLLTTHTATSLDHNDALIREMAGWYKARVNAGSSSFRGYENLYISRQRATYRKLLNEDELIAALAPYNFKVVNMEDYTVQEQIALLSQVRNLVAVHGAGMTNLMYMPEGGLMVNLIHEHRYDPAFFTLANALNHDTVIIQGKAANDDARGPAFDSFSVDVPKIRHYLDLYLKR
ncbi:Capsular polysaccharide biosynthesis protein-like [Hymenobacter roseosalivarius DSM 11622]|uniref:Capsular polysaccharide biosynthesis protein-like n=1 Tax=Hymenobacter roseosalivarius DSM 11622 TaxID=645990 RepID=A0A1W1V827_9BACT|nr:glycosyltransferase family 61 protein [Hymenobacter roseosalivarius]SMB89508.1 Capsular polysaccharide biosynthesis protein-like [Hymenobacter roseosalivarius DSM 11622]